MPCEEEMKKILDEGSKGPDAEETNDESETSGSSTDSHRDDEALGSLNSHPRADGRGPVADVEQSAGVEVQDTVADVEVQETLAAALPTKADLNEMLNSKNLLEIAAEFRCTPEELMQVLNDGDDTSLQLTVTTEEDRQRVTRKVDKYLEQLADHVGNQAPEQRKDYAIQKAYETQVNTLVKIKIGIQDNKAIQTIDSKEVAATFLERIGRR